MRAIARVVSGGIIVLGCVAAGGHRLRLQCVGTGGPVVVMDQVLAEGSAGWWLVRDAVARTTTVCTYDRAGYGWSDPGPLPRTSGRLADDLRTPLANAGVPPPYVLVDAVQTVVGAVRNR